MMRVATDRLHVYVRMYASTSGEKQRRIPTRTYCFRLLVHVRLSANEVCLIASCCSSARGNDKDVAVVQHRSKIVLAIFIPLED